MPAGGDYYRKHIIHQSASTSLQFTSLSNSSTVIPGKTGFTLRVQRIIVWINTSAANSITFQDTSATPIVVAVIPASPGADTRWDFDFGPDGQAIGDGQSLQMIMTAGNAGNVEILAYYKPDAVVVYTNPYSNQGLNSVDPAAVPHTNYPDYSDNP